MNRIRERREAMGLTQRMLSDKSGVSLAHVCNLENEKYNCSVVTGTLLAKALNTTLDGLFWDDEKGETP